MPYSGYYGQIIKPAADLLASFFLLIFLLPLFCLVCLVLLLRFGRDGVFFIQSRPGFNGRPFWMYKFKTMQPTIGQPENLEITKIGKLLRKTSLDELPQLINVLKGEMSLVGPRPLLMEYLPLYSERENRRHSVKPGITGLAQVMGRNRTTWQRRFAADYWYACNQSLALDLYIIFKTFHQVFKTKETNFNETQIMPVFEGWQKT